MSTADKAGHTRVQLRSSLAAFRECVDAALFANKSIWLDADTGATDRVWQNARFLLNEETLRIEYLAENATK